MSSSELFLNFLTQRNVLTSKRRADLASVIAKQQGSNIVELLVRGGFVKSEDLARYEAEFFNLEYSRLSKRIPDQILSILPFELARDCGAICFSLAGRFLKIALVYPDTENMAKLRFWAREKQVEIEYCICSLLDYENQLNSYLVKEEPVSTEPVEQKKADEIQDKAWEKMPIDKVVAVVLREAINQKATEVLISKEKDRALIRFRLKENLIPVANLPEDLFVPLINYLKGLAHLPLTIKNNFVQGQIQLMVNDLPREFELKVLDSVNKEVLSIKPRGAESTHLNLDQLGFSRPLQGMIEESLARKTGKIVVVCLDGSGKTTTLHSLVQKMSGLDNHIVTVEKNIENNLPGVTRIQVKPEIGLSYENILPEIQRWQPDCLVLDEIDGAESASHVLHPALSGMPIMTTVEGNSIVQGLKELLKLDLEIFHLSSILNLILAQRLIRRVCSHCSESLVVPNSTSKKVFNILGSVPMEHWPRGLDSNSETLYAPRAAGCSWCDHTGYSGKLALHEGLLFNDRLKSELSQVKRVTELDQLVERYLMINMLQDGLIKALRGLTTLDEVFSNCEKYNII